MFSGRSRLNCGYFLTVAASGFFLYKLCAPFVRPRNGRFWRVLLFLTLAGSTGMVIWIGDPNLLYTLPAFFALFLLSTRGDRIGRAGGVHHPLLPGDVRVCPAGHLCGADQQECAL